MSYNHLTLRTDVHEKTADSKKFIKELIKLPQEEQFKWLDLPTK